MKILKSIFRVVFAYENQYIFNLYNFNFNFYVYTKITINEKLYFEI